MYITPFAKKCLEYLKHGGEIPTDGELSPKEQEAIARSVTYGREAALAVNKDDWNGANAQRNYFSSQVYAWMVNQGLNWGQYDLVYQIGYNGSRQKDKKLESTV